METRHETTPNTDGNKLPTEGAGRAGVAAVASLAAKIATEAPELAALSGDELEAVARLVIRNRLVRDLDRRADLAGIDYATERATFLDHAGRTRSPNTRRAYESALTRLDTFASRRGLSVLDMKARDADDFAYGLSAEGRAPASVRRDIAAASSFFAFLERRADAIRNPFRGTKARPDKRGARAANYPSEAEAAAIIADLAPAMRAAAVIMAERGLRVGALPSLTLRGPRFLARSKGKDLAGEMPPPALAAIKAANLDSRRPFGTTSETRIADAIRYASRRLAKAGTISAPFSAHDFRHLFALREYRKDRDLYRVSALLGHASIQVTECYLKGLGEDTAGKAVLRGSVTREKPEEATPRAPLMQ